MKRLVLIFPTLLLFLLVSAFVPSVLAQEETDWVQANTGKEYDECKEGRVSQGCYVDRTNIVNMGSITCKIIAIGPSAPGKEDGICYNDEEKFGAQLRKNSAVAQVASAIGAIYDNPPASTYLALRDFGETLGFVPKQTYAQGIGYAGLSAILPVWKVFRNIAYGMIAIIMIVIGFMIMFRKHIDPKTVVTAQNSLPKIVITLLLITFSYAIVGLLVDLMYLGILLGVGTITAIPDYPKVEDVSWIDDYGPDEHALLYTRGSILSLLAQVVNVSPVKFFTGDENHITELSNRILGLNETLGKIMNIGGPLVALLATKFPRLLAAPAVLLNIPTILALLIALALLFLVIRLFIFFLSAYIQIILALIFAPVQLVFEALPGSTSFSNWIKNLLGNILVFPISAIIFMLAAYFSSLSEDAAKTLWVAPYVPFASVAYTQITALLSVAILFTIPSIAGGIREQLKAKPFVDAGPGTIIGAFSAPVSLGTQLYHMWQSHQTTELLRKQAGGGGGGGGGHEKHG